MAVIPQKPDPLRGHPPADRYCDLILNGGVASGVVYPWALVELARHFRFRRIGGNSVGAMAAAVAAAAEYGRCVGNDKAFEPLRQAPLDFATEEVAGKSPSGMLRLFQPGPGLAGWFEMLLIGLRAAYERPSLWQRGAALCRLLGHALRGDVLVAVLVALAVLFLGYAKLKRARWTRYGVALLALLGLAGLLYAAGPQAWWLAPLLLLASIVVAGVVLRYRLNSLRANGWGLCTGKSQGEEEGLIEWLHRGIQVSAGRGEHDPPLTFADLWYARPGVEPPARGERPDEPAIDLQMFSTLVSLGRPVRWPLVDPGVQLFYRRVEWEAYFPKTLLDALDEAAPCYERAGESDPPREVAAADLRRIPAGDLPIAIAARMSLSFPLLFSCVPVYAIDYEVSPRTLRRAWMTDGGLCTNFPIHLFDAALPRCPTFGLMLSRRLRNYDDQPLWLPRRHLEGRADNWDRGVPDAAEDGETEGGLFGLLLGMAMTAQNWNDALTSRLPQVRNRVLRMALRPDEGQLNLVMPGERILDMAGTYGTRGGRMLVRRFGRGDCTPRRAWREHVYVRALTQLRSLRTHLRGFAAAAASRGHSVPIADLLERAKHCRPLRERRGRPDRSGDVLTPAQADALRQAIQAVALLEQELERLEREFGPYDPVPAPELVLRAPL